MKNPSRKYWNQTFSSRRGRWLGFILAAAGLSHLRVSVAQPFTVQGPGVNSNDFRVTIFASGLNFPLGMTRLADDSLLVVVNQGTSFSSTSGQLVRLTDTNQNGIADGPPTVLYSGLPGSQTSVQRVGSLVIVTGDVKPMTVLRTGASPTNAFSLVGQMGINYPPGRQHSATALCVRKSPGYTNRFDLLFQLGAEFNMGVSTNSLMLTNSNIPGAQGVLASDAIHMLTLIDNGTTVTATNLQQVASGLRNPAGIAFHPTTGDLYFEDNGIDGAGNEAFSADELNFIARTNIGGPVEFFGFPSNYTAYRTGTIVGGAGIQPLFAFQPIPNPATGRESEGANDIAMAPPGFPAGFNRGVFIGFHGKFNSGGINNEENPVVYADLVTQTYFHFILGQQAGIGHLDGLLATSDSLFISDLVTNGNTSSGAGAGVIYQIKSLLTVPPTLSARVVGGQIQLSWDRGYLQEAGEVNGPWTAVADAFSPYLVQPDHPRKFYRVHF